jgi:hypothetical protein
MTKLINLSLASAFALACLTGATLAQDNSGNNGGDTGSNNGGANSSDSSGQSGQPGKSGAGDNNDPTSTSTDCRDASAGSKVDCKTNTTAQ